MHLRLHDGHLLADTGTLSLCRRDLRPIFSLARIVVARDRRLIDREALACCCVVSSRCSNRQIAIDGSRSKSGEHPRPELHAAQAQGPAVESRPEQSIARYLSGLDRAGSEIVVPDHARHLAEPAVWRLQSQRACCIRQQEC
jgi:hypothetical protein